jgi:predicted dehydrogenase
MNAQVCRWGILSTAAIAGKNWRAIALSGNSRVSAIASRSQQAAEKFIAQCQSRTPISESPTALGSYEALLERDDVDAVYIPLPTATRREWVIRAAEAKKHVLCEKPIAVCESEAKEMVDACTSNGVQFMDGVMFMHSQRLPAMRRSIDDSQRTGKLRRIASHFTFCGDDDFRQHNIRTMSQLEPFGCLGDVGWYNLRLTLWVMNFELPKRVVGNTLQTLCGQGGERPVPGDFSGELFFENGVSASFYCSFMAGNQQVAVISGENGYVALDDFVLPWMGPEVAWETCSHHFDAGDDRFFMRRHGRREAVVEYSNGAPGAQEVNMIRCFSELVLSGRRDSYWPRVALATQRVMDACLKSAELGGIAVDVPSSPLL